MGLKSSIEGYWATTRPAHTPHIAHRAQVDWPMLYVQENASLLWIGIPPYPSHRCVPATSRYPALPISPMYRLLRPSGEMLCVNAHFVPSLGVVPLDLSQRLGYHALNCFMITARQGCGQTVRHEASAGETSSVVTKLTAVDDCVPVGVGLLPNLATAPPRLGHNHRPR